MSVSDVNNRGCNETSGDNSNGKKRQMLLAIAFEDNNYILYYRKRSKLI